MSHRLLRVWLSAALVAVAMLLLAHVAYRHGEALTHVVVVQDQIGIIRQSTLLAQLHAERMAAGDASSGYDLVQTSLARAIDTSEDLALGRGALRQLWMQQAPDANTALAAGELRAALLQLESLAASRSRESEVPGVALALRGTQRQLETALATLEAYTLEALDARRRNLAQMQLLYVLLLLGLGLALLRWQRDEARREARAEADLRSEAERTGAFIHALPDPALRVDAEGRIVEVHAARTDLLACEPSDAAGQGLAEVLGSTEQQALQEALQRARQQGRADLAYGAHTRGGGRAFEARLSRIGDGPDVLWLAHDVTERERDAARLAQLGRLYALLSAANQSVVFSSDEDQLFKRVIDAAVGVGGYCSAALLESGAGGTPSVRAAGGDKVSDPAVLALELVTNAEGILAEWLRASPAGLRVLSIRLGAGNAHAWAQPALHAGLRGLSLVCLGEQEGLRRVLLLQASEAFDTGPEEQALLAEIAGDLEFALQQFGVRRRAEQLHAQLELQALALNASRDGILLIDAHQRVALANPAAAELLGEEARSHGSGRCKLLDDVRALPGAGPGLDSVLASEGYWQGEMLLRRPGHSARTLLLSVSRIPTQTSALPRAGLSQPLPELVLVFTDLTRQREADARLHRMVHFDALTGLPNRSLLCAELFAALQRWSATQEPGGVLMLDMDNFRTVNESIGQARGDELLRNIALRLSGALPGGCLLARPGGDEFVVIAEQLQRQQDALGLLAARLQASLQAPVQLPDGERVYTQASLGIVDFDDCGGDPADALRNAELALFEAKASGRNAWRRFEAPMAGRARARLALENRLREALASQCFRLVYQPLVRIADQQLVGLEALVRLEQPGLPPLSPDTFIPVLEETGLISALGEWVTLEACLQARRWLDAGWDFGYVAVNLSPAEVSRYPIHERVRNVLDQSGLPARRLELEITETGLMEQGGKAEHFLRELHALGVRLSIDDFGTGYSSLASLRRFPVGKLKIDRSFVTELVSNASSAHLVEAIIGLGQKLGVEVLAEGVETQAQLDFLHACGCPLAQGYLFSRPLPPDEVFRFQPRLQGG
ncbi:MAG: EAL domain-containing protein [Aquimonas sp.]|nr:EAL domain-containing protein [Aquimonas sp.]